MATSVGMSHSDLPPELATTPGQKRKRASESASPESRRNKRGAPAAAMTVAESDAAQAFLENTVSIAQAAHDHVNVEDFSALAQATAADHNDAADTTNASNTAAAALNIYPSLHVPQSTEEAFANQPTPETHHEDNTFSNHAVNQQPDGLPMPPSAPLPPPPQQPPNGVQQEQRYSAPPNPKPAVGSEEWHKMRKDNHKEGRFRSLPPCRVEPSSDTFLS